MSAIFDFSDLEVCLFSRPSTASIFHLRS